MNEAQITQSTPFDIDIQNCEIAQTGNHRREVCSAQVNCFTSPLSGHFLTSWRSTLFAQKDDAKSYTCRSKYKYMLVLRVYCDKCLHVFKYARDMEAYKYGDPIHVVRRKYHGPDDEVKFP